MTINYLETKSPFYRAFEEQKFITSFPALQKLLPQYNQEVIQSLFNISRGPEGGRMETLGLVTALKNSQGFTIDGKTIKISNDLFALDLENEACNPSHVDQPAHLEFTAIWDEKTIASGEGNNILGDNGGLYFRESSIQIPIVKATNEALAYYGAILIPENTAVCFPGEEAYPIWSMHVGSNYVRDYMMSESGGGGFYLEFHHDQPHFHMMVDGGGYYLLAKQVEKSLFHITAFELSNGQAVYTKKGAIHCDAGLTGELIVGYTASNDCSTVLLRNERTDEMLKIEFVPN